MGLQFYIACRDCKVKRDLDKFYTALVTISDREQALLVAEDFKDEPFRSALLISFMAEHTGHNCTFVDENNSAIEGYREDGDFWTLEGRKELHPLQRRDVE